MRPDGLGTGALGQVAMTSVLVEGSVVETTTVEGQRSVVLDVSDVAVLREDANRVDLPTVGARFSVGTDTRSWTRGDVVRLYVGYSAIPTRGIPHVFYGTDASSRPLPPFDAEADNGRSPAEVMACLQQRLDSAPDAVLAALALGNGDTGAGKALYACATEST